MPDSLGDRMKTYENVTRTYLTRRTPVIIRLDGCHFHSFTRGFDKPFDEILCKSMQETMQYLCEHIQNCVLGYTQSDEITLVLCDYKKLTTSAWFDDNIQKMASVSASMATMKFNTAFTQNVDEYGKSNIPDWEYGGTNQTLSDEETEALELVNSYGKAISGGAIFDSRVFNIPKEEVCNCLIWRQQDATRNSIQGLGQKHFSHKQLENKSCDRIQDMLMTEKNINWNDTPTKFKRGSCCIKTKNGWEIDNEIPIFTQDRDFVEKRLVFDENE